MQLHADAHVPFPRDLVFTTYRDEIPNLLRFLPNVRAIEVKSRKDNGPAVEIVNEWRGGGEIPAAARAVLSEAMLSWTDYATWHADTLRCDWRTETHAMKEAIDCMGNNLFLEDGPGKTVIQIRGKLEIDAKKIRGVPGFLAGTVGRTVEEFLGGKIQLNLVETAKGVTKYLEEKAAR
jgi:hypothetical protein